MPHPESERRRQFLRWTLSQNAYAHSRDTLADLANELKFLDEMYEMRSAHEDKDSEHGLTERDPDLLAKQVTEPDPKSEEIKIDVGKFNS